MRNWFFNNRVFYESPGFGSGGGGNESGAKSEREILDEALSSDNSDDSSESEDNEEDSGTTAEDSEEDRDEDEQDDSESDDEEVEEEEDVETEEENTALSGDSVYQALKKLDKDIFKKVPELRGVIFREQQLSQYFSSVKEAEEAYNNSQILNNFEKDFLRGNSEGLFKALSQNKESLNKFVGNLLPTLEKTDKNLYADAVSPVLKQLFRNAIKSNHEALIQSAKNLHWFVFGDHEIDKDAGLTSSSKADPREEEYERKERELQERTRRAFSRDVVETATKRAKRIISKSFDNSDISDLMKGHLTDEIFKRVLNSLENDRRYNSQMVELWKKAEREEYTQFGKDSLTTAFLSRAKVLIPQHRQKVLAEAKIAAKNGGSGKKKARRVPSSSSSVVDTGSKKVDPKKVDWRQTTEAMALEGKYVFKS